MGNQSFPEPFSRVRCGGFEIPFALRCKPSDRNVNRSHSRVPKCREVNYIAKIALNWHNGCNCSRLDTKARGGGTSAPIYPFRAYSLIMVMQRKPNPYYLRYTYSVYNRLLYLHSAHLRVCLKTRVTIFRHRGMFDRLDPLNGKLSNIFYKRAPV